jgi:hypothetical protein
MMKTAILLTLLHFTVGGHLRELSLFTSRNKLHPLPKAVILFGFSWFI